MLPGQHAAAPRPRISPKAHPAADHESVAGDGRESVTGLAPIDQQGRRGRSFARFDLDGGRRPVPDDQRGQPRLVARGVANRPQERAREGDFVARFDGPSPGPGRGKTTHRRSPSGVLSQASDEGREAADGPLTEDPGDGPPDNAPGGRARPRGGPRVHGTRHGRGGHAACRAVDGRLTRESRALGRQVRQAEADRLVVGLVLSAGEGLAESPSATQEARPEQAPSGSAARASWGAP